MLDQKRLVLLMILLTSLACSTNKRKIIKPDDEPEWLYSPQSLCVEGKELCATGEGSNFSQSDAKAKKALASIFETTIDSKFQFTKQSFSDSEISQMTESIFSEVNENVEGILKASEIKERFKKKKMAFSLAVIDVPKSSKILKDEIKVIDDRIHHYFKLKNRLYLKKLNVLFNQRNLLNEKYTILTGKSIGAPLSIASIEMLKYKSSAGESVMLTQSRSVPSLLNKKIEEVLSEVGYKIKKENSDYSIHIDFDKKEEYLNVEGFKKYRFDLTLTSRNGQGKKLGSYIVTVQSSGRNQKDALSKVNKTLLEKFESNIEKLNLN